MPTFSIDDLLPSMPVPCLGTTCDNYLESVRPFVNEEELKATVKVVEDFKNGVGKNLQVLLVEKAKHERNWLEKYWLDYAYLEWRDPIAPYVNTSGMLGGSTEKEFQYVPAGYKLDVRLSYAALQCYYYAEFHAMLRNETFPVQKSRNSFFSMNQWRGLFNTCRIPQLNKDRLDIHFKTVRESSECPTHITVMYKYRFYRMESCYQGKPLNITELYKQLEKIVVMGDSKAFGVGIGALTADNRDSWAQNRQHLIELNPENANSFKQIEQSMYVVVLDEESATNNSELAKLGLCGDPKNRFFDKSVNSICTKNGRFTSNVDHTPFDGMVSGSVTSYAYEGKRRDKFDISKTDSFPSRSNLPEPHEIHFVYDHRIEMEIQKAANIFKKNADQILTRECKITNCGKEMIKTFRTNPDTFAQMCMQLAYYQVHRKPAPTYETATTRGYYHGRTETVRSSSSEALEWCKQMCNEDIRTRLANSELLELFKKACHKHDQLMGKARQNALVDRHLLGLRLIARDLDMKLPAIYTDPSWKKSGGDGNYVISSSCLGFTNCVGTCGPMCLNGYSMIYAFPDDGITFELARFAASQETCLDKMSASLQSAFDQTKGLFKVKSKI